MPDLEMRSDILAPEHTKTLKFTGHNPTRVLKLIPSLIKSVFRIGSTKFFEDMIKWDKSADPIAFFAAWRGGIDKDARTTVWVKIKVQGEQSQKDKMGEITIVISGSLVTKFPYTNILQKGIARMYSHLYYSEQRRKYIIKARRNFKILEDELRKELGIMGG